MWNILQGCGQVVNYTAAGEIALSVERISAAAFYPFLREGGKSSEPKALYLFVCLLNTSRWTECRNSAVLRSGRNE